MSYQTYKEYMNRLKNLYQDVKKVKKTEILNHAVAITNKDRKTLIRRLSEDPEPSNQVVNKIKRPGRPPSYPKELLTPLFRDLWFKMGQMSARHLKAALPDWLPYYRDSSGDPLEPAIIQLVYDMSPSTIERFLTYIRKEIKATRGISTTSRAIRLLPQVPIAPLAEQKAERPGYMQSDTVSHCGTSTAGQYISSLTLTDLDSTWTENRALWGKTGLAVRAQFVDIRKTLPFDLWAVNTDSGSEFINQPMIEFMSMPFGGKSIAFTRSRPYRKNDNCYVEQKNFTHVRALFGYDRLEVQGLVPLMNEIYKDYWNPLQNFFVPSMKIKEKIRVGSKILKTYDQPITPYQRLIQSSHLTEEQKDKLRKQKALINPFQLQDAMEEKLRVFFVRLRQSRITEAA